jgi:tetratricopeptide (TPR) repeat protein
MLTKKSLAHEQEAQVKFFEVLNNSNVADNSAESFSVDYATTADSYMAIAKEYEETAAGNTSYYMAASNYLYANDLANAKAAIEKFQEVEGEFGQHINAMALTLKGDIAVEEMDYQSAAAHFEKALAASTNSDIYGQNAMKLALVYEAMGDDAKAQQVYKTAIEKHSTLVAKFAKYIKE